MASGGHWYSSDWYSDVNWFAEEWWGGPLEVTPEPPLPVPEPPIHGCADWWFSRAWFAGSWFAKEWFGICLDPFQENDGGGKRRRPHIHELPAVDDLADLIDLFELLMLHMRKEK